MLYFNSPRYPGLSAHCGDARLRRAEFPEMPGDTRGRGFEGVGKGVWRGILIVKVSIFGVLGCFCI
jgi:hypothetical protein